MEKIKVLVKYKDNVYSKALSKALTLSSNRIVISPQDPDIVLDETIMPQFQPVSAIVAKTMALLNCPQKPVKSLENTIFTAFTAGIGGGGLSSCAFAYAKISSRIFNRQTAFLSYDPKFRNSFNTNEAYDIEVLDSMPDSGDYDELVIDIPSSVNKYRDILDMCERRVVILGYDEKRVSCGQHLYEELLASSENYIVKPKTFVFQNHFEELLNLNDIHSQLGKEILELAKKLETE